MYSLFFCLNLVLTFTFVSDLGRAENLLNYMVPNSQYRFPILPVKISLLSRASDKRYCAHHSYDDKKSTFPTISFCSWTSLDFIHAEIISCDDNAFGQERETLHFGSFILNEPPPGRQGNVFSLVVAGLLFQISKRQWAGYFGITNQPTHKKKLTNSVVFWVG